MYCSFQAEFLSMFREVPVGDPDERGVSVNDARSPH